ncbi:MAG: hypothetical protein H5U22_03095 [Rhizobium sp.]|nr:hypothetical protein [Rhizobium sp.]
MTKFLASGAVAAILCLSALPAMAARPADAPGWGPGGNPNKGAPLPIAALGLPFAVGLAGFVMRRK